MALWSIVFGDYALIVDRRDLTFSLTETKTGTVWAEGLSLGWMEIQDRETDAVERHAFGAMKQVSVSEKAGPQGKRILFGLDCKGIPVDVYLICSQREIQIQIEANRDTRTHQVHRFGLLPGLCAFPDDGMSYVFLPSVKGTEYKSRVRLPDFEWDYPIWRDLTMPFIGAVRRSNDGKTSALGLFTDSAYSSVQYKNNVVNLEYERDPERRRLDVRCLVFPQGDALTVAKAYREKVIGESNHITLRKKMRERPALDAQIGHPVFFSPSSYLAVLQDTDSTTAFPTGQIALLGLLPMDETKAPPANTWESMEERLAAIAAEQAKGNLVLMESPADWAAISVDAWFVDEVSPEPSLLSVVHRDSVIPLVTFGRNLYARPLLQALLLLATPYYQFPPGKVLSLPPYFQAVANLLCPLYRLTFAAFLVQHRHLTKDGAVVEAIYSDKTRVVVNQSHTNSYETEEFALPPYGFYVRHAQREAHNALRVGATAFPAGVWHIRQSQDGKPLEQSADIETLMIEAPPLYSDLSDV